MSITLTVEVELFLPGKGAVAGRAARRALLFNWLVSIFYMLGIRAQDLARLPPREEARRSRRSAGSGAKADGRDATVVATKEDK